MRRELISRWRFVSIVAALLVVMVPAVPVFGQAIEGTTTLISIDAPTDGQTFNVGEEMDFGGWAADPAGPGTGVDSVEVVMDGLRGSGGTSLGMASYGSTRSDVAQAYGKADYTNSGFNLIWRVTGTAGRHTAYVYAHSIANGWRYKTVNINISGTSAAAPMRTGQTPYGGQGMYGGQQYGAGYGGYGGGGCPYDPNNPTCMGGYGGYGGYGAPPPPPPYYGGGYGLGYPGYGGGYPGYGGGAPYTQTVTVVGPTGGNVTVTWIAVPSAQSYRVYQANAATPASFTIIQTVTQVTGQLVTNATVSNLVPGQLYYIQVRAVDVTGLETVVPASVIGAGIGIGYPGYGILTVPTGFTSTTRTSTTITLVWAAVPGATSYRVLQSSTFIGPFTQVVNPTGTTTTTTLTVAGLTPNTTLFFEVQALDQFGNAGPPAGPLAASTLP